MPVVARILFSFFFKYFNLYFFLFKTEAAILLETRTSIKTLNVVKQCFLEEEVDQQGLVLMVIRSQRIECDQILRIKQKI